MVFRLDNGKKKSLSVSFNKLQVTIANVYSLYSLEPRIWIPKLKPHRLPINDHSIESYSSLISQPHSYATLGIW